MKTKICKALTWNCEGIKNNIFLLKNILEETKATFVCVSEPQLYQCDANSILKYLQGEYCCHLNSEDVMDQELPFVKSRAFGGTLMLWLKELDPFIEVIPTNTAAFLPVVVKMPGLMTTVPHPLHAH